MGKRKERKKKFNEELDRDVKLLIEHGYVKIDPSVKQPTYEEFDRKMKEWGFYK